MRQRSPGFGAGESSVIRSLAVVLTGPANAAGLNQVWRDWQRQRGDAASIGARVITVSDNDTFVGRGRPAASFQAAVALSGREGSADQLDLIASGSRQIPDRSIWVNVESRGWFAASFDPFRRFTGRDVAYERLFFSSHHLAGHLLAFNEAVALTEGFRWLSSLRVQSLESVDNKGRLFDVDPTRSVLAVDEGADFQSRSALARKL